MINKDSVIESLRGVLDPEIGISIVDLNMVRDITVTGDNVKVKIALTVAHCPLAKTLQADVENALKKTGQVKTVTVDTTAMTKTELADLRTRLQNRNTTAQSQSRTTVGAGIERLGKREIRNIIAIVSGKGGVGKSFVTAMLATQLRNNGYEVGILDADLTGPSIAKIFGLTEHPTKTAAGAISPIKTRTGIKVMSINLVLDDPAMPVIWRGPIVNSVIRQLYWDVDWGPLHYLLVDLPPGCVAANTIVYANSHPVRADELKPGDRVYSLDVSISKSGRNLNVLNAAFTPRKVLDVIPQGEAELFELRTRTRRVQATFNHPILTIAKARSGKTRSYRLSLIWKRLAELKEGDVVAVVKKLPEHATPFELPKIPCKRPGDLVLPVRTTVGFGQLMGYYLGDGFVRFNEAARTYQVMFAEPRRGRYRKKYIHLLKAIFPGSRIYEDEKRFGILSKQVAEFFRGLHLDMHALEKRVPPWIFELPRQEQIAIIEGYCDADGHRRAAKPFLRSPGWMVFESPNQQLLEDIRTLAISTGMRVTNLNSRTRSLSPPSGRTYSRTFWSFECSKQSRSMKYGAGMIRGNDDRAIGKGLINEFIGFDRVTRIVPIGRQSIYDIEVEGNQNFVADGLVVHNTSDAPLTVFQSLPLDGVIVVSSPQELASLIVTKAVNMAKKMNADLLGLIENMSSLRCPHCGKTIEVYGPTKGEKLAEQLGIPFLGSVALDPEIAQKSDEGQNDEYNTPELQANTAKLRTRTSEQKQQLLQGLPIAWSIEPSNS